MKRFLLIFSGMAILLLLLVGCMVGPKYVKPSAPLTPFPSWPLSLAPQQTTVPQSTMAQAWAAPTVTAVAFEIPDTAAGSG